MPTLNVIPRDRKKLIKDEVFQGGNTLNIGSGGLGGCGRWLWTGDEYKKNLIINLDIQPGPSVNVCGDAHALPFENGCFDSVVLQAVLEHVVDPSRVVNEVRRVLKRGGKIYIEVPFLQGFHADPHDYQRYTLKGLQVLTKDFTNSAEGVSVGPFCTLVWILRDGFSSCFSNRFLYVSSRFSLAWLLSPIRYLDLLARNLSSAHRLANEHYILAEKP